MTARPGSGGRAVPAGRADAALPGARTSPRVAVLSGTTPLHVQLIGLRGITVIPVPMRDTPHAMVAHMAAARADCIVPDAANKGLARHVAGDLPVLDMEAVARWPRGDGPRACLRTGGTTGHAKLIEVPRRALAAHHAAAIRRLDCGPESVWWAALPLWHMGGFGLVDRCLHGGGALRLPGQEVAIDAVVQAAAAAADAASADAIGGPDAVKGPGAVMDPASAGRAGRAPGHPIPDGVTHVSLVPTMLHRLVGHAPPKTLRCALLGGDRLPPELAAAALAAGWPVHASYGLTEACGQVATALPAELEAHPGTCGLPLDGITIRILVDGAQVDAGMEGEIVVAGLTLAEPGPLRTGDLGWLDDDGRLFVTGRRDDRIATGGEKVDPERVEDALRTCPGVVDAGVVGVPDTEWGQRVVAFIVGPADPGDVRAFARRRLAPHEVPKAVHVLEHLPRTPAGKLRRGALRLLHTP